MTYVPLGFNPQPEPPTSWAARYRTPVQQSMQGFGRIATVDISHFRAPYKNAYPYTGIGATVDLPMVLGLGFITVASIALLVHLGRK